VPAGGSIFQASAPAAGIEGTTAAGDDHHILQRHDDANIAGEELGEAFKPTCHSICRRCVICAETNIPRAAIPGRLSTPVGSWRWAHADAGPDDLPGVEVDCFDASRTARRLGATPGARRRRPAGLSRGASPSRPKPGYRRQVRPIEAIDLNTRQVVWSSVSVRPSPAPYWRREAAWYSAGAGIVVSAHMTQRPARLLWQVGLSLAQFLPGDVHVDGSANVVVVPARVCFDAGSRA